MTGEKSRVWELPGGWEWKPLGDSEVAEVIMGQSPPGKTYNDNGEGLPFFQGKADFGRLHPTPRKWCSAPNKVAEPGDILISVRAPVGPTNLCAETSCIGRGLAAIRPGPRTESKFLLFALRSREPEIAERGQGSTFPAITKRDLLAFQIPLPPLDKQRRIVARIEALFARMEEARRLRTVAEGDAERLMPAALVEILEVTKQEYTCQTIDNLIETGVLQIIGGGTPSKKNAAFWSGTIPWVSPKDMKRWIIDDTEDHITSEAVDRSSAKLIPERAVLVVVRGMILARTWPVAIAGTELTINQDMKALCTKNGLIPEYLGYALRGSTPEVLNRVETAAHGTKRLKTETLEAVEVPIPPILEQHRIVDHLDGVQAQVADLKRLQAAAAVELERLEGAVLARAFQGEL